MSLELSLTFLSSSLSSSYSLARKTGSGLTLDDEGSMADARQRKVRQRIFKEKPFKVMHVCLATDVQVSKLRDDKPWNPSHFYKEHVLFSLRMYSDGLLEMAPEFSRVLEEDETKAGPHSTGTAQSLFMSNKTVAVGIKKGLRLHTYRLRSDDGSEFEYTIENLNAYTLPSQVEAHRAAAALNDALAGQAVRAQGPWKMDPPAIGLDQTVSYMAEIISGSGFDGEELFVSYHISVPPEWSLRTGDLTDGLNEDTMKRLARGEGGNKRASLIAQTVMEMDGFDDDSAARGVLQGCTHTAKARATRGGLTIPILRPFWKGHHLPFSFDGISRLVWGCSFFLLTVIAFVVGVEYPFWLIPCLIFTFGLGTGYPGGPSQACLRVPMGVQNRVESRVPKSKVLVGAQVALPEASFNHLFAASFDRKRELSDIAANTIMPSAAAPTIVFQVYSRGMFGRVSLEGYGYHHLPATPGMVDVVVRTWRPLGGIANQLDEFFLGSSVRLKDPNFVDMPSHLKGAKGGARAGVSGTDGAGVSARGAAVLNRFGVSSATSGELRFRCHVVTATPSDALALAEEAGSGSLARTRSVEEILKGTGGLRASSSLATLGGSGRLSSLALSGSGLGLGLAGSLGGSGVDSSRQSTRESDSASLSRRAEMLLAQAKSKVAALSAFGVPSSAKAEVKEAGAGAGGADAGVASSSSRRGPSLGLPAGLQLGRSGSGLAADSKDGPTGLSGSSAGSSAGSKALSKPGRYSDSEDEGTGLLGR